MAKKKGDLFDLMVAGKGKAPAQRQEEREKVTPLRRQRPASDFKGTVEMPVSEDLLGATKRPDAAETEREAEGASTAEKIDGMISDGLAQSSPAAPAVADTPVPGGMGAQEERAAGLGVGDTQSSPTTPDLPLPQAATSDLPPMAVLRSLEEKVEKIMRWLGGSDPGNNAKVLGDDSSVFEELKSTENVLANFMESLNTHKEVLEDVAGTDFGARKGMRKFREEMTFRLLVAELRVPNELSKDNLQEIYNTVAEEYSAETTSNILQGIVGDQGVQQALLNELKRVPSGEDARREAGRILQRANEILELTGDV